MQWNLFIIKQILKQSKYLIFWKYNRQGYFTLLINSNFGRFELGVDWVELDWIWVELGWIGLNWAELGWIVLHCAELGWIGLNWAEFGWIGLNWVELDWIVLFTFFPGADDFFWGGVPYPIFFGPNLLVRVKLCYTPNFTARGHVELP